MDQTTPGLARTAARLSQGYSFPDGGYDEAFLTAGIPRPHWQEVVRLLDTLGPDELGRRWTQARQMLYEHGVRCCMSMASPSIPTATPSISIIPGNWTPCPVFSRMPNGVHLRPHCCREPVSSMPCLPMCTVPKPCFRLACYRLSWCMHTRDSCAPATMSPCPTGVICICPRWIWHVPLMDSGVSWRITRKIQPGWDMPWKRACSSPAPLPISCAPCLYSVSPRLLTPCVRPCRPWHPTIATIRVSSS